MEKVDVDIVKEKIKNIIANELRMNSDTITDDAHIEHDIGVESAEMISLLYAIETEFDIEISNEEASQNMTVQQMTSLVIDKMDKNPV